jgi:hypothetical protein
MEQSQVQKRKNPHDSGILNETTWVGQNQSYLQRAAVPTPHSTIPTRGHRKEAKNAPAAPKPQLLFVHSSGDASKNQWSVGRRAINAHVQREQASKKKQAAKKKLLTITKSSPQVVQVSKGQRIAISELINGDLAPQIDDRSITVARSPTPAPRGTLALSRLKLCPSCGLDVTSEFHIHGSVEDDTVSSDWQEPLAFINSGKAPGSVSILQRSITPSPATTPALNPFANSVVPVDRRMSLNLDYCM